MKKIDNLLETLAHKIADQDMSAGKELNEILEYYSTKISESSKRFSRRSKNG